MLALIWALGLAYGHLNGDTKFLDRAEGALTDWRLIVRGERPAPDCFAVVTTRST